MVKAIGNDLGNSRNLSWKDPGYVDVRSSITFGAERVPNADRPTLVLLQMQVYTDGTSDGEMQVSYYDNPDSVAQFYETFETPSAVGAGNYLLLSYSFIVLPGDGYEVSNNADPNGGNGLWAAFEVTL